MAVIRGPIEAHQELAKQSSVTWRQWMVALGYHLPNRLKQTQRSARLIHSLVGQKRKR